VKWLDASSFWEPDFKDDSAWIEHAPFAFWLTGALRPRCIVELGTHGGFSFFAFCQAVERRRLDTTCVAIDTWQGDPQAGFYGEDVYRAVSTYAQRYASFARLMRTTFDEAASSFADRSIDLLHIDGLHSYEAVRNDFETWAPKVSNRGVVLFHDTNVRKPGFGVYRLWEELRDQYPSFEFLHGYGLGVLAYGADVAEEVDALIALGQDDDARLNIQSTYARLGAVISLRRSNSALQETINRIKRSTFWRVTAPFREIRRLVRRASRGKLRRSASR
jgi:hypothetical protein